uniref:Uncharacterized protein n=1 Tax=Pyramimonas obovata TaxID=1411642 RepID=A0A7S0RIN3_9CHLO
MMAPGDPSADRGASPLQPSDRTPKDGATVRISGLKSAHLNGKTGEIEGHLLEGRFTVFVHDADDHRIKVYARLPPMLWFLLCSILRLQIGPFQASRHLLTASPVRM